ncbi:hypothetical protein BCU68_15735 [Vibrio sp. 10N.286.49.B3]|uniref:methyl-accepting chemotaxis protein n=1 Tax=Vibrio sp. 10N.286.49.B3 TaxID=1880855 RepID=UPI000C83BB42|nr:methyl-accepting chemotaxis protein [Vibrio sp. 10N.286.49.B3]PMH41405.1 hypothetical protein BCU68_15735 [Vibrio sp. 10N.286.49.B3]
MSNENKEYFVSENELLVSTTDLVGNITFADKNFIRVSGFSNEELMGQPHSIIRHPDMPKEAFEDFWNEISAGHCWSGIIKNRQKDGGFYWVKSDVTPLYEDGTQIGFMSVRSMPNKTELEKAKILYAQFKEGEQGNRIFMRGKIVKKQKRTRFSHLSIKQRLFGQVLVATVSLLIVLCLGIYSSYQEKESVSHLYNTHIESYGRLLEIDKAWGENKHLLELLLLTEQYDKHLEIASKLKKNSSDIKEITTDLVEEFDLELKSNVNVEYYREIAKQSDLMSDTFLSDTYNTILLGKQDERSDTKFDSMIVMIISEISDYQVKMEELATINRQQSLDIYKNSQRVFWLEATFATGVTAFFIAVYLSFAYFFNRDIAYRLKNMRRCFMRLVKQDYLFDIDIENNDEIGKVFNALKVMKVQLAFNMENMKQKAIETTRIKIALDSVSTNVMIEDNTREIIYANPAIMAMFKHSEQEFQVLSDTFDADKLIGQNTQDLQLSSLSNLDLTADNAGRNIQEVEVNGRIFNIVANPVIDENHQQIGYVTEWSDRTSEIAVEKEIENVIHAAVSGDFTQRMGLDGKNAFFTMLCENMNRLLEINEVSLAEIVKVLSSLAEGDLTSQITADYTGAFGELKDSSNMTVEKLKEMILHIKISADTINTAAKEIAIGNVDLAQRTEKQARSLEVTSSSMEELTITVKQNSEHSKQANSLAKDTSKNALKGGEIVKQVVDNMNEINTSSQEVMSIISVIDSIAFQTNILALNAAVEAARAGEQGRGFAVVATEVRNLAQRSAAAAKEVKTLINSSVHKIELGSKLADQAGESIDGVVDSIQEVAQLIEEITLASVEQSVGLDQVSRAVLEVDDVTQQNSALVEESSAAASSLEEQVANLAIYVAAFDTGEEDFNTAEKRVNESKVTTTSTKPASHSADDHDWSEF